MRSNCSNPEGQQAGLLPPKLTSLPEPELYELTLSQNNPVLGWTKAICTNVIPFIGMGVYALPDVAPTEARPGTLQ